MYKRQEELVYSESANPHELLGPHITEEGVLVQMLMPTAKEALVVVGDKTYPMELADEAGFFAALLPRKTIPDYTLKVTFDNGVTEELKDPYACLLYTSPETGDCSVRFPPQKSAGRPWQCAGRGCFPPASGEAPFLFG